jgi:uncharacterized protein
MIPPALITTILSQYRLRLEGTHGVSHWARVLENGRRLAADTGADLEVVELFAIFHDACRENDGGDHWHGSRAAELAASLHGRAFSLPEDALQRLLEACDGHTNRIKHTDVTIQTCWDSDRLDLLRVGIWPDVRRLNTPAARSETVLAWANKRAASRFIPNLIMDEWGIDLGKRR